jgi:hypothetical protein
MAVYWPDLGLENGRNLLNKKELQPRNPTDDSMGEAGAARKRDQP